MALAEKDNTIQGFADAIGPAPIGVGNPNAGRITAIAVQLKLLRGIVVLGTVRSSSTSSIGFQRRLLDLFFFQL